MDSRRNERPFGSPATPPKAARRNHRQARASFKPPRSDDRVATIVAAATHVMAREGYERANMRAIAAAAEVSLAGLYHYFPSKERLLFHIQFHGFSALLTEVRAQLAGVTDPPRQLEVLIHTHVAFVTRDMDLLTVCSQELGSLSGDAWLQVRRIRREYYQLARQIIARIVEDHAPEGAGTLDTRIATMSLFGALNWLFRWYDPQRDRAPSTLATQLYTQFLAGLLGAGQLLGPEAPSPNGNGTPPSHPARRGPARRRAQTSRP